MSSSFVIVNDVVVIMTIVYIVLVITESYVAFFIVLMDLLSVFIAIIFVIVNDVIVTMAIINIVL